MVDRRVIFVGDSFVAGVGDPTGLGWVGHVVAAAFAAGLPLTSYNLGVRGETSVAVAERWEAEAAPRLAAGADSRLVLSFGANDTAAEDGVPAGASVQALRAVVTRARERSLPVLVVSPPPVNGAEQGERIAVLSARLAAECGSLSVPFVDVTGPLGASPGWRAEVEAGDGAHPGAAGYTQLAALVREPLLCWLTQPAPVPG